MGCIADSLVVCGLPVPANAMDRSTGPDMQRGSVVYPVCAEVLRLRFSSVRPTAILSPHRIRKAMWVDKGIFEAIAYNPEESTPVLLIAIGHAASTESELRKYVKQAIRPPSIRNCSGPRRLDR